MPRLFSAGNAGASKYITLNAPVGGGDKKQGLASTIGRIPINNYNASYGNKRDVLFYMNQLGGVGRNRSMFLANTTGVHIPKAAAEEQGEEPLTSSQAAFKQVTYIGWWATESGGGPLSLFQTYIDAVPSGTHLILPFIVFAAGDATLTQLAFSSPIDGWMGGFNGSDAVSDANRNAIRAQTKVMASFGGFYLTAPGATQIMSNVWPGWYLIAGDPSHPYYDTNALASDLVTMLTTSGGVQIDGFDLDIEGVTIQGGVPSTMTTYTGAVIPVTDYYATFASWLGKLSKSIKDINPAFIVTHAPQTPYYHSDFGNIYNLIEQNYGNYIDFYNIQYYNQGPASYYDTAGQVFESDSAYHASVNELVAAGISANKIVVGKPIPSEDYTPNPAGYLNLWSNTSETTMTTMVQSAFQSTTLNVQAWTGQGGIMCWFWQNSGQSVAPPWTADEENVQLQQYCAAVAKM